MLKTYSEFTKKILSAIIEEHSKENTVISPYSVANLLAISAESTTGLTREEVVKSVMPNGTYDEMISMISELIVMISREEGVSASNAAIVKQEIGESILDGYSDDLCERLDGELLISNDLIQAANEWVNEKTGGKISRIMDDSMSDALACLINAILFQTEWADKYEERDIEDNRRFSNADGTVSNVTMLHSCENNYIESKYFTGFTKPYKNGFSYMALLPVKKGKTFMQKAANDIDFCDLYNNRSKMTVTVDIPEYSCEFKEELNQVLSDMGIKTLFTDSADFSNMCSVRLKMSRIIHKAKIEVDRQGTRAAAVSAGTLVVGGLPDVEQSKTVILNRPFIYAIIHNETGLPLFVGTVNQLPGEKKNHLDPDLYIHPSDKAAMIALKAIPGFSQVMKAFMKVWDEKTAKILNMSTHLKLSEKQMKKYYDMLPPICEKLGIDVPELYVELNVSPNAYTWGDTKPYIVLTSGLFETLPDELISSVIAHECGHIACHHPLYTTMGNAIINGAAYFTSGLGNIALYPIQLAFAYWMRCSELSADRAAAIYEGESDHVVETMMRFAGYDKDIMAEANVEAFLDQAKEYRQMVNDSAWNKTLEFIMFKGYDHPLNAVRALEVCEWVKSDRFENIQSYLDDPEGTLLPIKLQPQKYLGKDANKINSELIGMGFEDVELVRSTENEKKTKTGEIVSVSVDGDPNSDDDYYLRSAKIVLVYFEPKTNEEIAGEHPNEIKMEEASKYYIGKHYGLITGALKDMGFTNYELREMAIPKMGFLAKPDTVAKIIIDDEDHFEKDSWYAPDVKIKVYYYVKV